MLGALIVLISLIDQGRTFESLCRKLSVSTDITTSKDDVIKEGVT
jgi:hypothetical protein